MSDPFFDDMWRRSLGWWPHFVVAICCVALIMWLKLPGVFLAFGVVGGTYYLMRDRGESAEAQALRSSIALSAEDIGRIIADYDNFLASSDPNAQADRLLHRPALADPDCEDEDIEQFLFMVAHSRRYVSRLEARMKRNLTVPQLETLLATTDERASELEQSWLTARRRALKLGTDYNRRQL